MGFSNLVPEDGPCVFTGKTVIYFGTEEFFDDRKGHVLFPNNPWLFVI
jgi:hypothetical protein